MTTLATVSYSEQSARWPTNGRHILAQYDAESVVAYQAYRPSIGRYAATRGFFGGEFSLNRMSWIKPNFLWMMYRSGWGSKEGQQVVLAVRLRRPAFDEILAQAVHSSFVAEVYGTQEQWQEKLKRSCVRLQWDPDHAPNGSKLERRAIQLGLRGEVLGSYAKDWVLAIEDISDFVAAQRENLNNLSTLRTPAERVYPVSDRETAKRLGIDMPPDKKG
ncbi:MAG: DUF4291 domain-containing protein [Myxococcales bacterium]|nr:DUF4291 domain-containing protein [Myxococcales bacterium]